ncbi:MAG: TRAP transporter small permease [Rhodospirillales bacterium]|nr:TRAP transporter small permease [Rhodospirillales bacterium]MDP6644851.1 TRAP transporter small permease [Rhodospirillales bacterium]MDP6840425.1 TRAP transporter small permease [Rhodospirillales bacterium]
MWLARAGSVGLAVMMFLTLGDVIGRMFNSPIVGTVEVTELIMGMMIYLGVGYTTLYRGHIRVDILITQFSQRVQGILDVITYLIAFLFMAVVCWRLFLQAASRIENNDITQIWEIQVWPIAFIMAFASVLMVTSLLLHLVLSVRTVLTGEPNRLGGGTQQTGE